MVLPYPGAGNVRADLPGRYDAGRAGRRLPARALERVDGDLLRGGEPVPRLCADRGRVRTGVGPVAALLRGAGPGLEPASPGDRAPSPAAGKRGGAVLGEPVLDARPGGNPLRPGGGRSVPVTAGIPVLRGGHGFPPAAQDRIPGGPSPSRRRVGACRRKGAGLRRNAVGGGVYPPDIPVPGYDGRVHRGGDTTRGDDLRAALRVRRGAAAEEVRDDGIRNRLARENRLPLAERPHQHAGDPLRPALAPVGRRLAQHRARTPGGVCLLGRPVGIPLAGQEGNTPGLARRVAPGGPLRRLRSRAVPRLAPVAPDTQVPISQETR